MQIVLATNNAGKLRELSELLALGPRIQLVPLHEVLSGFDVVEDAGTLEGNALKKALEVCEASGLPALADDSGLEVDALGGAPGVYTARYAGEWASDAQNVAKLLQELHGVPPRERGARFRCVLALVLPSMSGNEVLMAEGIVRGRIAEEPRGSGGFGYDPIFVPKGRRRTFAQLSPEEKAYDSHRVRAASKLGALARCRLRDLIS